MEEIGIVFHAFRLDERKRCALARWFADFVEPVDKVEINHRTSENRYVTTIRSSGQMPPLDTEITVSSNHPPSPPPLASPPAPIDRDENEDTSTIEIADK